MNPCALQLHAHSDELDAVVPHRRAYELAFSSAYMFSGVRPVFLEVMRSFPQLLAHLFTTVYYLCTCSSWQSVHY